MFATGFSGRARTGSGCGLYWMIVFNQINSPETARGGTTVVEYLAQTVGCAENILSAQPKHLELYLVVPFEFSLECGTINTLKVK